MTLHDTQIARIRSPHSRSFCIFYRLLRIFEYFIIIFIQGIIFFSIIPLLGKSNISTLNLLLFFVFFFAYFIRCDALTFHTDGNWSGMVCGVVLLRWPPRQFVFPEGVSFIYFCILRHLFEIIFREFWILERYVANISYINRINFNVILHKLCYLSRNAVAKANTQLYSY